MKYNIKVGEKYLVGENMHETLKGTVTGDTTAVYSRFVGEMSAYDFCDIVDEASCFDRVTACDYIRGIMERQNYGFYLGDIKVFDADHEETIVHCKHEENAKVIARILDLDEQDTFLVEEEIWGKDAVCEEQESLKQKMWNALYAEEDKLENHYVNTDEINKWFVDYRPFLQRGFDIAINVIAAHEEGR